MIHPIEKMMQEDVWMTVQILTMIQMEMKFQTRKVTPVQIIMLILVGVTTMTRQNLSLQKCVVHAVVVRHHNVSTLYPTRQLGRHSTTQKLTYHRLLPGMSQKEDLRFIQKTPMILTPHVKLIPSK